MCILHTLFHWTYSYDCLCESAANSLVVYPRMVPNFGSEASLPDLDAKCAAGPVWFLHWTVRGSA